jgi:hypothetical protein
MVDLLVRGMGVARPACERQEVPAVRAGAVVSKRAKGRAILGPSNSFDSVAKTRGPYGFTSRLSRRTCAAVQFLGGRPAALARQQVALFLG